MLRARLILVLLLVLCFSLATYLQGRQAAREAAHSESGSALALLMGDGREMVADRLLAKADAYFHRGKYPSIFELNAQKEENHMAAEADEHGHPGEGDHDEHEGPTPPHDWIEAFGRHFTPNKHVHLEGGNEREMLPWLQMSAQLDPKNLQTYLTGAYFLRERLGKVDDAEEFLRQGLRTNPNSPDLLYELGRIYLESRKDLPRAKNI